MLGREINVSISKAHNQSCKHSCLSRCGFWLKLHRYTSRNPGEPTGTSDCNSAQYLVIQAGLQSPDLRGLIMTLTNLLCTEAGHDVMAW